MQLKIMQVRISVQHTTATLKKHKWMYLQKMLNTYRMVNRMENGVFQSEAMMQEMVFLGHIYTNPKQFKVYDNCNNF